ncbi:hypothetical protein M5K25_000303 [Dendrobium thyrsiflorum]|uniref:4-coumarate--CoA ligase n=1 Tax=Dendrobium thyrsiflorum TaxID=117978 RepID=A0ABD0W6G6_DENTH
MHAQLSAAEKTRATMEAESIQSNFSSSTGIYTSPFPSLPLLPSSPPPSLPSFLLHSPPHSSHPAFIDSTTSQTLTYSSLTSLTASISHTLTHSYSIRPNDIILLISPNSILFPPLSLAIMSCGAILSTANHLLTRRELISQVQDSHPSLILTTQSLYPKLLGLIPRPPVLIDQFLQTLTPSQTLTTIPNHAAALMYSSGTTGRSKGVICTHGNLVHVASVLRRIWGTRNESGKKDVYLCVIPLFHMFGFSVFVCGAVAAGATVVVMERYSLEGVLEAVEKWGVTRMPAVPPMVVQMVKKVEMAKKYDLRSLKEVICSGAPLAKEFKERFVDCYPGVVLSQCYGLTEASGPLTLCDGVEGNLHHSIGRLIPSIEAKIIDDCTGESLPPNKHGELCVRGPPIMQGYLNNPEATSLAIDEQGWLHTGDLCYIDNKGLVYVVDRIKELIKYKAYQVAPVELEELLSTHPGVEDVAVISFPDEEAGEIPMACVVRKAGFEMQKDELIAFMDDKVAPYKRIRKVMFVEFIPRSPSGKIIRRHLKDLDFVHQRPEISARL